MTFVIVGAGPTGAELAGALAGAAFLGQPSYQRTPVGEPDFHRLPSMPFLRLRRIHQLQLQRGLW